MVIVGVFIWLLLTTFNVSNNFGGVAQALPKMTRAENQTTVANLSLSKPLIHTV